MDNLKNSLTVNAAVDLLFFVKSHKFPEIHTPEFTEFAGLLDALESALYRDGIVKPEVWSVCGFSASISAQQTRTQKLLERMLMVANRLSDDSNWPKDHACAECVPYSDVTVDGFKCARHAIIQAVEKAKGECNGLLHEVQT